MGQQTQYRMRKLSGLVDVDTKGNSLVALGQTILSENKNKVVIGRELYKSQKLMHSQ